MSMSWYSNLLEKLRTDGPIRMYVSEEEYAALLSYICDRWTGRFSWTNDSYLLLLAFLRGYTFYRELSEHEDQFWASFHRELGLNRAVPTPSQYEALWIAFNRHPLVSALCIETYRREFVKTIDAVWGIRSLRANQLVRLFLAYYRDHAEEPITGDLIRRIVPDAEPSTVRQAASYNRVFGSLVYAVDFILSRGIRLETLSPDELVARIEQSGLTLGHPNPIRFLHHKSSHALPTIIATLRNEPRWRERKRRPSTGKRLTAWSIRKDVRVTLMEPPHGFPLAQIVPTRHQGILIEGQVHAGEVLLPDGRFRTFRWKSCLGKATRIQVSFEEGEVITFEIEADCLALRLRDRRSGEYIPALYSLDFSAIDVALYNPYRREWLLRYSLASDPSVFASSLRELWPHAQDQLLVEVCTDRRSDLWQPLARVPVQVRPVFRACELVEDKIQLAVWGPKGTRVHITERTANSSSEVKRVFEPENDIPVQIRLTHPAVFQPVMVDISLEADAFYEERSLVSPPRPSLEKALRYGIGWGKAHKAMITPGQD